ncbi:prenyltransferase/squalene oxidase repeat-containing protein [Candidatus Neomarinimicrobiota bacterium]
MYKNIIKWLLNGDVSLQYQVKRDLLGNKRTDLRDRIAKEGWGTKFLTCQNPDGHWGQKFYQPKWISTHYTVLDLKNLGIVQANRRIRKTINMLLEQEKGPDGGINPSPDIIESDVCLNGMFLNYACYFKMDEIQLQSIVDFIILQNMPDGGFNCYFNRPGAKHSSLHSTLSVLEGIYEYETNGYKYRLPELQRAEVASREFILEHKLYLSSQTGEIINKKFLKLPYPSRWYYDTLRALDYFRISEFPFDERMQPAIHKLLKRRKADGRWVLNANHPGQIHFHMEKVGKASRWNTLRALRVLEYYNFT